MYYMHLSKIRVLVARLPRNLISNRLYIVIGTRFFFRVSESRRRTLRFERNFPHVVSDAKLYLSATARFRSQLPDPRSFGIYIAELGMFGNMFRRLAMSISIALSLSLTSVIAPKASVFSPQFLETGKSTISGKTKVDINRRFPRVENTVKGLIVKDFLNSGADFVEQHTDSNDEAWAHLSSLFSRKIHDSNSGEGVLTIHLRGGDVFGPRKPAAYGQPPLGYYKLILNSKPWTRVDVVYQDDRNPVVAPLVKHLRETRIHFTLHSGTDLEDISILLRAQNLVAGRGTFLPAVVGLSRVCKSVYFFEDKMDILPPKTGLIPIRVFDSVGEYRAKLLSGNWENSAEQRALMLAYPAAALSFDIPCGASR